MSGSSGGSGSPFIPATPGDIFDLNTTESYQVKEQSTALYAQLDFKGNLFSDVKFSGNAGCAPSAWRRRPSPSRG